MSTRKMVTVGQPYTMPVQKDTWTLSDFFANMAELVK
jgi:hypothetical protein